MVRLELIGVSILLATAASAAGVKPVEQGEVCRAAIAVVMGRDPKIMKVRPDNDVTVVSYCRPSDGSFSIYRCRLEGNRVVWASSEGRWRTHPDDEVLTFEVTDSGTKVKINETFSDGSKTQKIFRRGDLR